jgi:hypothetical protein
MALMLTVIGLSTQMFRRQSASVSTQTGRLDAQQNSRFAVSMLERELRVAGVGVADQQPLLVMANKLGITFNANLVSLDTGDLGAVYINPDADTLAVNLFHKSARLALPGTSTMYPDTDYTLSPGVPSHAETISYWMVPDSMSTYSNEYALYRRVNARPARLVARGLRYNGGSDVIFHYYKTDTLGRLVEISQAALPLIHTAAIHGAQTDTGKSALTDSIRQVRVELTSIYHDPRTQQATPRSQTLTIHLMNAGLLHHTTCGEPPLAPTSVTAIVTPANGTTIPQPFVTIAWTKSIDDGAGEKDVERYALYRRLPSATEFDEPFASVPGAASTYSFDDTDVTSAQTWIYGVASLDCSPATSSISAATQVVIP